VVAEDTQSSKSFLPTFGEDKPLISPKAKVITVLWFLNAVKQGGWFSINGQTRREYEISSSLTNKILASLESSGHVKLWRSPGKAIQIKLIKPKGWKKADNAWAIET
jgi:hypothetical protein